MGCIPQNVMKNWVQDRWQQLSKHRHISFYLAHRLYLVSNGISLSSTGTSKRKNSCRSSIQLKAGRGSCGGSMYHAKTTPHHARQPFAVPIQQHPDFTGAWDCLWTSQGVDGGLDSIIQTLLTVNLTASTPAAKTKQAVPPTIVPVKLMRCLLSILFIRTLLLPPSRYLISTSIGGDFRWGVWSTISRNHYCKQLINAPLPYLR